MKNIKITLKVLLILVFGLSLNLAYAQTEDVKIEVKKKEKKITIRKVKEVNGEKIEWDTTLVMTDENKEEVEKYLQEHANVHSEMNVTLELLDEDMEGRLIELKEHQIVLHKLVEEMENEEGLKEHIKVIVKMTDDMKDMAKGDMLNVYELSDGHKKLIEVTKGEYLHKIKEHNQQLKELRKDGKAYAYFVKSGDSTVKIDLDFDHDFDFDMENEFVVDINVDEDGENNVIWIDDNGSHKKMIKHFTKKGDKKGNIMFFGDDAHSNFSFDMNVDSELTEADFVLLKKAGVKVKTKELAVNSLRLTYEDDSFGLVFKLKSEGKATVKVADSNGEIIFKDKVQYFPGTYHKSLDLNNENVGSYLIYIEQAGASFTSKFDIK